MTPSINLATSNLVPIQADTNTKSKTPSQQVSTDSLSTPVISASGNQNNSTYRTSEGDIANFSTGKVISDRDGDGDQGRPAQSTNPNNLSGLQQKLQNTYSTH
jgi:hypothetical protein